ncbi:hypothetical protein NXH64_05745 [Butyrivibrio fibrisolvens]|uniref:hypothetical protein n=1 Tax=Pseudobutyrivibrio ruminis TaxID=46206 RepID=UPI0004078BDD|nr:hypothetical protein [Pseudobutyrivibrio ruminis]MDC7279007.1 hypothetical protein [Butyrivibrio fibrisolvens]
MAISPIRGVNSYMSTASIQPMSYAVENEAEVSDVFAAEVTKNTAGVNGANPVQYPNANVKTESIEKEQLIDPTAMLEQRRRTASAFNEIASQFRTANTGYSKAGIGNSYGLAGNRFDAFA